MLSQVKLRAAFLPTRGGNSNNVNVNVNAVSTCNSNRVQQQRGLYLLQHACSGKDRIAVPRQWDAA